MIAVALLVMGTYKWIRNLISRVFSRREKEALVKQVEELKTQLHQAEQHSLSKEQRIKQLSTKLESETNESKALWDQVGI